MSQNQKPLRHYGDGGTIHGTLYLDVETDPRGNVVAVWFRCQPLPFRQVYANEERGYEMDVMYDEGINVELHAVDLRDLDD